MTSILVHFSLIHSYTFLAFFLIRWWRPVHPASGRIYWRCHSSNKYSKMCLYYSVHCTLVSCFQTLFIVCIVYLLCIFLHSIAPSITRSTVDLWAYTDGTTPGYVSGKQAKAGIYSVFFSILTSEIISDQEVCYWPLVYSISVV